MRLIDADALKEMLIKERDAIPLTKTERYSFGVGLPNPHGMSMRGGINKAFKCMEKVPTIDAVPVCRCKDCCYFAEAKFNEKGFLICPASGMEITGMDFCSYGERMDGDNDV